MEVEKTYRTRNLTLSINLYHHQKGVRLGGVRSTIALTGLFGEEEGCFNTTYGRMSDTSSENVEENTSFLAFSKKDMTSAGLYFMSVDAVQV